MVQTLFVGVDGGATKCIVRIEDEAGTLIGREIGGPANIRLSVTQTWQSINTALAKILNPLGIRLDDPHYRWQVGMGLAGCEMPEAPTQFLAQPHGFETLVLSSDAHIACLGAHEGRFGSIIIIGTGVVGFQIDSKQQTKVGGWGFPHDDEGGGAWLGLEAVRLTLQAADKRLAHSDLTRAILAHYHNDLAELVHWANQANSTAFAELAPLVMQQLKAGERTALALIQRAAQAVNRVGFALAESTQQNLNCALIGSVAPFIESYLEPALRTRLVPCQRLPDAGAIMLVRKHLESTSSEISEVRHG